jgi:hypothetical protein
VSSSDPQPPMEPAGGRPPSTQEIPVVQPSNGATAVGQLPPHPHATTHAPVRPMGAPEPTGPVDFVPGLPGLGAPPPPPPPPPVAATPAPETAPAPAAPMPTTVSAPGPTWPDTLESGDRADDRPGKLRVRRPRNLAALLGPGLVVLAVVLLELGLSLDFGARSYWSVVTLWAAFATACALLALLAFAAVVASGDRLRSAPAWRVAAAGLAGVAVFWLLVVLPDVGSDRGFVLTAALGALGGALWVGPRRKA